MHANCQEELYFAGEFFIRKNNSQSESTKASIERSRTAENSTCSSSFQDIDNQSGDNKNSSNSSNSNSFLANVSNSSAHSNASLPIFNNNSNNNSLSSSDNNGVRNTRSSYPAGSHTLVLDNNSGTFNFFSFLFRTNIS